MKWEPTDIIRLVALIGALVLFALGAFMMWQGISAEGAIDIKSSVLSGSIKTASAGLFISFLSFSVIVFVLTSLSRLSSSIPKDESTYRSKSKRVGKILALLFICFIVSGGLAALGYGSGFGIISFVFGFLMFFVGIAYLTILESE